MERLNALEHTDLLSPVATASPAVPTSIPADWSRSLLHWFSVGFVCACIAGGIALLAEMTDNGATEDAPSAELNLPSRR